MVIYTFSKQKLYYSRFYKYIMNLNTEFTNPKESNDPLLL